MPQFTIAASGTTSDAIDIESEKSGIAIVFPAAMTGTSVAIHGSFDGTTFYPVYSDGAAVTIPFTASSMHTIPPIKLFGVRFIRLVSNGTEASARTILMNAIKVT